MSTIRERNAEWERSPAWWRHLESNGGVHTAVRGCEVEVVADRRTLLAALDALVEVVERVGGPGDACYISPDAGGPVCKVHYSAPVGGDICYWVAGFRAAIAHAKDVTG